MGFSDAYIIKRRSKTNQIPQQYISKKQNLLNFAVENIDQLILLPKEFDFPTNGADSSEKYIGFLPANLRSDLPNPEYTEKASDILRLKNNKSRVVYCSFGTIELKNKKIILPFLKKLVHVAQSDNLVLIISLKAQPEDIAQLGVSKSVFIFSTVPQLEVLTYTDVFITHGGINSIKEAVYTTVPMLMIPVHSDFDPKGNSARVVYHGLGLRGDAARDSVEEIREKIKDLLQNPLYKKNLQEMKKKDELYTGAKFLQHLNNLKFLN